MVLQLQGYSYRKNNQAGVVGVAYDSKIADFRVDWSTKSIASMLRSQVRLDIGGMDVTNNSWGFTTPFGDDFDSPLMEPLGESLWNMVLIKVDILKRSILMEKRLAHIMD